MSAEVSEEAFSRALAALQSGKFDDAVHLFEAVLQVQPKHVAALNLLGITHTQRGRFGDAEIYLKRALQEQPNSDTTLYNYGLVLKALHRPTEALHRFSEALALNRNAAETWNNRGTVFNDLKRPDEAIQDFDKAIQILPRYAEAYCNKAKTLTRLRRLNESLSAFEKATELRTDFWEAWFGRGNTLYELKRPEEALACYIRAQALKPSHPDAWFGAGNALSELKRYHEALNAYEKTVAIEPKHATAHSNRGAALIDLNRHSEALESCDRAIFLQPEFAMAHRNRGAALVYLGRYDEAFAAYDTAFKIEPVVPYLEGHRLHAKQLICNWDNLDTETSHLIVEVRNGTPTADPFSLLALPSTPLDQLACARSYAQHQPHFQPLWRGDVYKHDRVRIAYLSADFHEHATAYLIAGLFEQHDKSRFEVTAISFGPDDYSAPRKRIKDAVECFLDVRDRSDHDIAELIRQREIDIAIDLKGLTANNRLNVLARRPAPVQVSYLGYPGTMGAPYIDYILADSTVIPEDQRGHYTEKVIWLPDSYQINDDKRRVSEDTPSRRACGLPDEGFVYSCFNNSFKLSPEMFDIWMRLLKATESSVLWLYEGNSSHSAAICRENLLREAEKRNISPSRLIFAGRTNLADHLARHRQADLFLDTLPYNAHTTASDALWAGLPVVTCLGSTFAGRVAASLLKAAGLPELVTGSLEEYEALALKLARDASLLAAIKDRLARNRDSHALFNTSRSTRLIEAAYLAMWQAHQSRRPPASFAVPLGE
jgi:protein O-GlcNAc transferase